MSGEMRCTWWLQNTPATNYWRCALPARYLPGKTVSPNYQSLREGPGGPELWEQEGAAVFPFVGNKTRGILMAHLQERGVRVLLESDDNYTVMHKTPAGVDPGEWKRHVTKGIDFPSVELHTRFAGWVDGVIVSTPFLEREYRKVTDKPIFVCPNSVDPADWPQTLTTSEDGVLRVGFAGSISHWIDVHLIRRAMLWASKQDGVEVWYFGQKPAGFEFVKGAHHVPWTDSVADYRKAVAALDVGFAPLASADRWTSSKSDVKSLEYAMVGALPVLQDAEPYRAFKGPCLRAGSAKDFERAVRWCVTHRDEVKDMAAQARDYVLKERTIQDTVWRWREAVT